MQVWSSTQGHIVFYLISIEFIICAHLISTPKKIQNSITISRIRDHCNCINCK